MNSSVDPARAALDEAAYRVRLGDLVAVSGGDRLDLLQRLTTGDLGRLETGASVPTCLVTAKGRLVDRLRAVALEDSIVLVTSPGLGQKVIDWIDRYVILEEVSLRPLDDEFVAIEVVGPKAAGVTRDIDLPDAVLDVEGDGVGFPGARLLLVARGEKATVERALEDRGVHALQDAAWRAARAHGGLLRVGEELEIEEVFPYEVAFADAVSLEKGCFVGQEVLARLYNYDKIQRFLRRLEVSAPPDQAASALFDEEGDEVGSGRLAASAGDGEKSIAVAIVRRSHAEPGTRLVTKSGAEAVVVGPARPCGEPKPRRRTS